MSTEITLPGGATAIFKDADELSNRDVKVLRRAARKVGIVGQKLKELGLDELRAETDETDKDTEPDETATAEKNSRALAILSQISEEDDANLDLFQRVATVVRLESWTLDRSLPVDPDEVDDLPRPIFNTLTKAAADLDLSDDLDDSVDARATAGDDPKAG